MSNAFESCLFNSLNQATACQTPFTHWNISSVLPESFYTFIHDKKTTEHKPLYYDGTRAGNYNSPSKNDNARMYITEAVTQKYPFFSNLIHAFRAPRLLELVSKKFDIQLSGCYLRAECTFDHNGFFLHPHLDIHEKRFTLFVYLGDSPEGYGTDLYDKEKKWVKTIPFRHNTGYIFIPGHDTWHGFEPKEIVGVRTALLINYVTFPTDWPLTF